ncbi:hypothetical protein Stube_05370 [Streptomyces tubercidicus]|uniref:Uncharacterized protein n=1 Tax=Streptomyces tubercidicus TaxID=47759 RepID=A0A640UKK4_9ACTN|nr:hypothetical protein Stube_05370 [Streptomyces tubercidicus]
MPPATAYAGTPVMKEAAHNPDIHAARERLPITDTFCSIEEGGTVPGTLNSVPLPTWCRRSCRPTASAGDAELHKD